MDVDVLRKEISDTGESKYKVVRLRADLQLLRDGQLVEGVGQSASGGGAQAVKGTLCRPYGAVKVRAHTVGAHKCLLHDYWMNGRTSEFLLLL